MGSTLLIHDHRLIGDVRPTVHALSCKTLR